MKLQINHNVLGVSGLTSSVISLQVTAILYSKTAAFSDFELRIKSLTIAIRKSGVLGYINIGIPIGIANAEDITNRISGNVLVTILSKTILGDSYAIQLFDQPIDDFRYDIGANSAVYNLVLRGDFSTPAKQAIVLENYSSKVKLTDQLATIQRYVYTVNPNDLRYFSVGASFSEGSVNGYISEISLVLQGRNQQLLIEVEVTL